MGIRRSVFGSRSERRNYEQLCRQWGQKYRVYHNLSFLNVLTVGELFDFSTWWNLTPLTLTDIEMSRLKKTSIDFTLCDYTDAPILCIEFDGMNDGFNVGTKYVAEHPPDPWRETIMALKLKVAQGSLFPFVIVGSPQFEQIDKATQLTIVDGIVGNILAFRAVKERIDGGFNPQEVGHSQESFSDLTDAERHEVIQDWVLVAEIESEAQFNPICSQCAALEKQLGCYGLTVRYTSYPNSEKVVSLAQRRSTVTEPLLLGATVTVNDPQTGEISATVMLPNFQTIGVKPFSLAQEIAHLMVLYEVKKRRERT